VNLDQKIRQHRALARRVLFGVPPQDVILVQSAVRAVLDLHQPLRMYTDCPHDADEHERLDIDVVVVREIGETCEAAREDDICRSCCADDEGEQTADCADTHRKPADHCLTKFAIARELGIDLAAVTG